MKVKLQNPVYRKGHFFEKGLHDWPFEKEDLPKSAKVLSEDEVKTAEAEAKVAEEQAKDVPDTLSEMAKKAKGK